MHPRPDHRTVQTTSIRGVSGRVGRCYVDTEGIEMILEMFVLGVLVVMCICFLGALVIYMLEGK